MWLDYTSYTNESKFAWPDQVKQVDYTMSLYTVKAYIFIII